MNDVWFAIPSKRPAAECDKTLSHWRAMGYRVAVWRDTGDEDVMADLLLSGEYPGYAAAVNALCREILAHFPQTEWIVTAGDDTQPEPDRSPAEIAADCTSYFQGTFGVMQPTGDRYAGGSIDRIAGSPWMGREWCLRANGGAGPLYPAFQHMFVDECLKRTAELLGVYWMRPDLMHFHRHFMRASNTIDSPAIPREPPPHLIRWNSPAHWNESQALFRDLEAQHFAPCMPCANPSHV